MSRIESASGARYSVQREAPRKFEPIAPVGTNYTPIGRPDIAAMRKAATPNTHSAPAPPPAAVVPPPAARNILRNVPLALSPAPGLGKVPVVGRAPADAWPEEAPVAAPPPPPAANRPPMTSSATRPVVATTSVRCVLVAVVFHQFSQAFVSQPAARFSPSAAASTPSMQQSKPEEDDKIGPVGTVYTPIKLQPKKLVNPFAAMQTQQSQASATPAPKPACMLLTNQNRTSFLTDRLCSERFDLERAASACKEADRRGRG